MGDLDVLVRLHRELLPRGFFVQLGPRFLRRWHRTFIDSQHGEALVAVDRSGHACGFLLGTTDQAGHTADVVRRYRRALAVTGLCALLVRPGLAVTFLRTRAGRYLRRIRGTTAAAAPRAAPRVAVVHAIATVPSCRGGGVGRQLLKAFEGRARSAGAPTMQLVTQDGDEGASAFYSRLGWTRAERRRGKDEDLLVLFERPMDVTSSEVDSSSDVGAAPAAPATDARAPS